MIARALLLCDAVARDGGTESYLARVLPALRARGVDVVVRARTVRDPQAFGDVDAAAIAWASDEEPAIPAAADAVVATLAAMRPDAVLLSNVFDPGVVAVARRAPRLVVRVHDHRQFCPNGNRVYPQFSAPCDKPMGGACVAGALLRGCANGVHGASITRLRRRVVLKRELLRADAFVVSSSFMHAGCVVNGVPRSSLVIAPPPVDVAALERAPTARVGTRRVLFAGRIAPEKGLRSLIGALARIPADRRPALDVAGAPTAESARAELFAAARNVAVTMLGRLDGAALQAAYDAADVVAVPSLWPEPFGLVGIEAFARGRPVVAYDVGGVRDWIGAGGIAVKCGDESAFARALEAAMADDAWPTYAAAARASAERFTPDAHAARILPTLTNHRENEILCAS